VFVFDEYVEQFMNALGEAANKIKEK
jgi:hypothetical protein